MNIPEHLKKKRDELSNSGEYSEGESCSFYMNEIEAFKAGFDAACAELLPMIEKMEKALMGVSDRHNWMPGIGECVCQKHKDARQALAELKKWRES